MLLTLPRLLLPLPLVFAWVVCTFELCLTSTRTRQKRSPSLHACHAEI